MTPLASEHVAAYYESKTASILRRYGPGPRVHYHTGFVVTVVPAQDSICALRRHLIASQEEMLFRAAHAWRLEDVPHTRILDVGCGLGGGAISWAEQLGADVTALTIAPSHVDLVKTFATAVGVESLVHPLLCDAIEFAGENLFDTIIAIDSSCHLSRFPWFRRAKALLRKGGHLFIADCFLEKAHYSRQFNEHWCARIGRLSEYRTAAREAGLTEHVMKNISPYATQFWKLTQKLILLEFQRAKFSSDSHKIELSLQAHALMHRGLSEGGLSYRLIGFVKE